MRVLRRSLVAFGGDEDAASAVEFSIVLPILLVLLLGGSQVVVYINATRKVQQVATSVSEMLSQAAPAISTNSTATINSTDLEFSYDAALVIFPYVMTDSQRQGIAWRTDLLVSMASVSFTPNNNICIGADLSGCYTSNVDWTSTGTPSGAYRPCGHSQNPIDNGAPYNRTGLPRSLYGPGSVVVVDVRFTFTPTFGAGFVGPITITRSAFVQPRYVTTIGFDATNPTGIATTCPSTS
ncbi:TadE/TadG family type IV pilus assembly protein [Lichenihabitans sp. Uapishka_5]|uniref:TadE/TadG family type IV pilus assembly protein n=1 Tax=Lichenihabitans sp. Uapishka_5 TaxID=3037302 RepID=UPI0029E7F841|nr:TadE/TadG family type IV pilus assembly protein [Lichenihabitans sp. Uapishka_5]MDX7953808.1 TadE/TadG family type IV pilus assembly protein [Lichenihabitans sp. Uapishka_5]